MALKTVYKNSSNLLVNPSSLQRYQLDTVLSSHAPSFLPGRNSKSQGNKEEKERTALILTRALEVMAQHKFYHHISYACEGNWGRGE